MLIVCMIQVGLMGKGKAFLVMPDFVIHLVKNTHVHEYLFLTLVDTRAFV
ncbi:hypothetical protein J2S11_001552 [Bacillus horti]|uniref:Uncharacterized protein n=1 Tax=Caldalkalibacillus horti TaxID=77523 RepID=A0ABT9VXD5_9BACI|nr:hypothetical protein [Bacillus horti]